MHGPAHVNVRVPSRSFTVRETTQDISTEGKQHENDENLDQLVRKYFELESIGVANTDVPKGGYDRALKKLEEKSRFLGDRWETGLLWKRDQATRVDSYPMAYRRLQLLEKRLDRDPEYARLYYAEMQRFIDNGYVRKAEKQANVDRIWYLPHFGVTNVNKPNKIRLVFDAAAKAQGESYNDQLVAEPNLLKSLPGVLIRFRQHKIAYKGDISDMFLRIGIRKEDRGAQRFLYRGKTRNR